MDGFEIDEAGLGGPGYRVLVTEKPIAVSVGWYDPELEGKRYGTVLSCSRRAMSLCTARQGACLPELANHTPDVVMRALPRGIGT